MISYLDLTDTEFTYCLIVTYLGDYNYRAFCDYLLVKKYNDVQHLWHRENERIKKAQCLTIAQIQELQERLKYNTDEDKWIFFRALCHLEF